MAAEPQVIYEVSVDLSSGESVLLDGQMAVVCQDLHVIRHHVLHVRLLSAVAWWF